VMPHRADNAAWADRLTTSATASTRLVRVLAAPDFGASR
jgi:hypothetical protein